MHSIESTSLLGQTSESGFASSVITTYSCYFPFYEDVVLRRLMAAGCTHNVLMVDATRCAMAYADEDLRPKRAGRDYTLIPVRVGGVFHPKIFLRIGKNKGSLFVGSHNMTLSGFGLNDEITNMFSAGKGEVKLLGPIMRQVYEYLHGFIPTGLPDIVRAFEAVRGDSKWMRGSSGGGSSDRRFIGSGPIGPNLWSQIFPLVPDKLETVFISGPFFDPQLSFLKRIQEELQPQNLVIGIDPASADIKEEHVASLKNARWINVAGVAPIPKRREGVSPYLHSKILWFRGKQAELLVTGSANPSVAAFLTSAERRNAEAVVADSRPEAGQELGIEILLNAPPVTTEEWNSLTVRCKSDKEKSDELRRSIFVVTPSSSGFCSHDPLPLGLSLQGFGENNINLGEAIVTTPTELDASEELKAGAYYLEGGSSETNFIGVVHQTGEISRKHGGNKSRALQKVLGALEENTGQFGELLKLAEKVIFYSEDIVETPSRMGTSNQPTDGKDESSISSLAVDAKGKRYSKAKRSLAKGDIVLIIDALIRRLGEGIASNPVSHHKNEEEEIGADEEDGGELSTDETDYEALAKVCQSKMRSLVKRMSAQLNLEDAIEHAHQCIVQLAAVLGLVRALRIIEQRPDWRKKRLRLVRQDDEQKLFEAAAIKLFWGEAALATSAVDELNGEVFEELSMVSGLLTWIAWDVGIDAKDMASSKDRDAQAYQRWYMLQLFALVGRWFMNDETAQRVFSESINLVPSPRGDSTPWLFHHEGLHQVYTEVEDSPDSAGEKARLPSPGDLVILPPRENPRVRVVLAVHDGTHGHKAVFFDPDREKREKAFLVSWIKTTEWHTVEGW